MEQLGVVPKRSEALAASLSGGNQQKVLGKWLSANPRVLIVDESRGGYWGKIQHSLPTPRVSRSRHGDSDDFQRFA